MNHRNTYRILDHIVISFELLLRDTNICTSNVHKHFKTDHQAVIVHLDLNHILIENSGAKRRKRHKDTQPILNREKNKEKQWEKFHNKVEQTFTSPFAANWNEDYSNAYNNIVNQLLHCTRETLFWKNVDNRDNSRFTKTETLIFKGRRATTNLYRQAKSSLILDSNKRIGDLERLFPDIIWKPYPLPGETQRTLEHIKTKWQERKRRLYILKERETHKHIIEAVKTRNDNFKENKGKMLRSSLEKKFNRI